MHVSLMKTWSSLSRIYGCSREVRSVLGSISKLEFIALIFYALPALCCSYQCDGKDKHQQSYHSLCNRLGNSVCTQYNVAPWRCKKEFLASHRKGYRQTCHVSLFGFLWGSHHQRKVLSKVTHRGSPAGALPCVGGDCLINRSG